MGLLDTVGGGIANLGLGGATDIGFGIYDRWRGQKNFNRNLEFQGETWQQKYQWAVKDLEKAGLNPILAVKGGFGPGGGGAGSSIPSANASKVAEGMLAKAQLGLVGANTAKAVQDSKESTARTADLQVQTLGHHIDNMIRDEELKRARYEGTKNTVKHELYKHIVGDGNSAKGIGHWLKKILGDVVSGKPYEKGSSPNVKKNKKQYIDIHQKGKGKPPFKMKSNH